MSQAVKLILSCEHGGCEIPKPYAPLFKAHRKRLQSHEGVDLGALNYANALSKKLKAPLYSNTISRLLIETNRSLHHRSVFSDITATLPKPEKEALIQTIYLPHRKAIENDIKESLKRVQRVVHIACHSFTPVLNGSKRDLDIGLLYDPKRTFENDFCMHWQRQLQSSTPWVVRRNHPYKGNADGLTTYLRKLFSPTQYLGIELETNQALWAPRKSPQQYYEWLAESLKNCLHYLQQI